MKKPLIVTSHLRVKGNEVFLNRETLYKEPAETKFSQFARNLYKASSIDYPKFYKMDNLSKLAFLSAELLFTKSNFLLRADKKSCGVFIENGSSSLDTDIQYQQTINDKQNYFPNPSLFVYTLPNIMVGEICIKNRLNGENALFVFDKFAPGFLVEYIERLNESGKISSCLAGWVNTDRLNEDDKDALTYDSFLFIAEQSDALETNTNKLSTDLINNIFHLH